MRYLIILSVLTGCATKPEMVWYKQGGNRTAFNADMSQCRAQAFSVPGAMNNLIQVAIVQRTCMEGKGWELVEEKR